MQGIPWVLRSKKEPSRAGRVRWLQTRVYMHNESPGPEKAENPKKNFLIAEGFELCILTLKA
jgi:hypothetical protein